MCTFYSFSQLVEIHSLPEAFRVNIIIINLCQNNDGVDIITAAKEPSYPTKYYMLRTLHPEHFEIVYPVLNQNEAKNYQFGQQLQ